jgi:serine/threonine protein kinase
VIGPVTAEDVNNEIRAATKLCKPGMHPNIVSATWHGKLSLCYFLDMELCEFNLLTRIAEWRNNPRFSSRFREIVEIINDVANGLQFMHDQHEVHRDLKPTNGIHLTFLG